MAERRAATEKQVENLAAKMRDGQVADALVEKYIDGSRFSSQPKGGITRLYQKFGGYEQAKRDLYKIAGDTQVVVKGQDLLFVAFEEGSTALARRYSRSGEPTLEIINPGLPGRLRKIKVRYND